VLVQNVPPSSSSTEGWSGSRPFSERTRSGRRHRRTLLRKRQAVTEIGFRYRLSVVWVLSVCYAIYVWQVVEAVRR